jgi:hypothetical protein
MAAEQEAALAVWRRMSGADDHLDPTDLDRRIHLGERAMLRTLDQISERLATGADITLLCHVLRGQQESLLKLQADKDERDGQQSTSSSDGQSSSRSL